MVNEKQKGLAYSIQSFLCNAGSLVGYLFPFIFAWIGIRNTAPQGVIPDSVIYQHFANNPITKAVVIGGMEPFLQIDEVETLIKLFRSNGDISPIVIYTGYYPNEIQPKLDRLKKYKNIIIKFGRFIPDKANRYDDVLGITLSSDNQFAMQLS